VAVVDKDLKKVSFVNEAFKTIFFIEGEDPDLSKDFSLFDHKIVHI